MGSTVTNDSLSKAIAYLGAVEVAPGTLAFRGHDGQYRIINECRVLDYLGRAGAATTLAPLWWTPEQRIRLSGDPANPQRITANLETGAEVPA